MEIVVSVNGPYVVSGAVPLARQTILADANGDSIGWRQGEEFETAESYALCRCGHSANKPFCDGSHKRVDFDGTETASRAPYLAQSTEQTGPTLILTDAKPLCAVARFCDVAATVWKLVEQEGPEAARLAASEAALCPSGRLVALHRDTGEAIEPEFEPSIGIVDDPAEGVAGPIWVRGGIPIAGSDGALYQIRNRVTLCRCGASNNKPFCDGRHRTIGFTE